MYQMQEKTKPEVLLTESQRERLLRNSQIIDRFRNIRGATSEKVKELSLRYSLSESTIRVILHRAKLIGRRY